MPELPEVETVRATLEHQIVGEKITDVIVRYNGIISPMAEDDFKRALINQTIRKMDRYGKHLIFILDNCSMLSHLRMEGKYFLKSADDEIIKHEHIIFKFASGRELRYHDTRKFGRMKIIPSTDKEIIMKDPTLAKLGVEGNNPNLNYLDLFNKLQGLKEPIKTALLDQSIICGLGNIYVDEVCFKSRINPTTPAYLITKYDVKNIVKYSKIILDEAILAGGTTIRSYTSSLGVTGLFQQELFVHTKVGEPCQICGSIIEKTRVGGRGTYFCPNCQKPHPVIVGITGGIGTGKSSVSKHIKELGYELIDTDLISKELTNSDEVLKEIKDVFGDEYLINGKLNRTLMGKLVFSDYNSRTKLNNIIHTKVLKEVVNKINNSINNLIFIDVPLLFEAHFDELCHKIICVDLDLNNNIDRLMKRDNINKDMAKMKINSQMPLIEKKNKSDFIIDNSKELCYTYKQLEDIINQIKSRYKL